jgi:hypothetical protein
MPHLRYRLATSDYVFGLKTCLKPRLGTCVTVLSLLLMRMHRFAAELFVLRIHGLGLLDYNIDILDGI